LSSLFIYFAYNTAIYVKPTTAMGGDSAGGAW